MPRVSICIPTFNRSNYLAELLDSIVDNIDADVEVVVSDDASHDDTLAVAESYHDKIPMLRILAHADNLGVDGNFLAVTAAATGDYVWLMGDDDRIEPGGVANVLRALREWPNLAGLTVGVLDYDVEMDEVVGIRNMPTSRVLFGATAVFTEIPEHLGFMSATLIERARWSAIASDPSTARFANYYIQVYILGRAIGNLGAWGVLDSPCVGFRTGNDQFKTSLGWLERLKVDVEAYSQIGNELLKNSGSARGAMRRRIFNCHVMARLKNEKTESGKSEGIFSAALYLGSYYWKVPEYWLLALPMLMAPKWFIMSVKIVYQNSRRAGLFANRHELQAIDALRPR